LPADTKLICDFLQTKAGKSHFKYLCGSGIKGAKIEIFRQFKECDWPTQLPALGFEFFNIRFIQIVEVAAVFTALDAAAFTIHGYGRGAKAE
jgi:hypothetical protein